MGNFSLIDYSQAICPDHPARTICVSSRKKLQEILCCRGYGNPGFVDLVSSSGDCLSIGVGGPLSCLMFTKGSGDPPYLWARGSSDDDENVIEFERGGTPTPIPLSYCLPLPKVIEIADYYFLNQHLPQNVEWEEY